MIDDWDDAYANAAHIEGAQAYVPMWEKRARAFREGLAPGRRRAIAYGADAREDFELLLPPGAPRGLFVFVHGGYWRSMTRDLWSHLATGALGRGWAVALPGYVLCPQQRIRDITRSIAAAVDRAAQELPGPIRLAGHSAGGHLVARMGCADVALRAAPRIEKIISISGVHDLRPLMKTAMNDDLRLDLNEARAESPALREPRPGVDLLCWVGAGERPEFLRQNALLANVWTGCGAKTRAHEAPRRHHFSVIGDLADKTSALCRAALE